MRDSSDQSDISSLRCEVNSRGDGGLGGVLRGRWRGTNWPVKRDDEGVGGWASWALIPLVVR